MMQKISVFIFVLFILCSSPVRAEIQVRSLECPVNLHGEVDLSPNAGPGEGIRHLNLQSKNIWLKKTAQGIYSVNNLTRRGILLTEKSANFDEYFNAKDFGDFSIISTVLGKEAFILNKENGAVISAFSLTRPIDFYASITRNTEKNGINHASRVSIVASGRYLLSVDTSGEAVSMLSSLDLKSKPKSIQVTEKTIHAYSAWTKTMIDQIEYQVDAVFEDGSTRQFQLSDQGRLQNKATLAEKMLGNDRGYLAGPDESDVVLTSSGNELHFMRHDRELEVLDMGAPVVSARYLGRGANVYSAGVLVITGTADHLQEMVLISDLATGNGPRVVASTSIPSQLHAIEIGTFSARENGRTTEKLGVNLHSLFGRSYHDFRIELVRDYAGATPYRFSFYRNVPLEKSEAIFSK